MTTLFGKEGWQSAVEENTAKVLEVNLGTIFVSGYWAEQEIELKTSDGQNQAYLMILHLEDSKWKLFGTIPNP